MPENNNKIFKAASEYNRRVVNYNDDFNSFKSKRVILIEINNYSQHEKAKQKALISKINKVANEIASKRHPTANFIFGSSELVERMNAIMNMDNEIDEDLEQ